jgi:hypothetical protein
MSERPPEGVAVPIIHPMPDRLRQSRPDAGRRATPPTSPAVVRAVQVIDAIAAAPEPLTLADLTRLTGAPKSSLHGMCDTLVQLQLLKRLPGGAMALGRM